MIRVYELVVILMRLWFIGMVLISIYAASDWSFRKPRDWKTLGGRLEMALFWPMALCSRAGRAVLFHNLEER